MKEFIDTYKQTGNHSQNGEMGIISECIKRIKPKLKVAVEFGAADGFFCSNTAELPQGWKRHLYDVAASGEVEQKEITEGNVNELPKCSVLSIDIDGNDRNIWKAYKGTPAIVVIEINSSIPPLSDQPVSDYQRGTAYKPMVELGIEKGYFLLGHTGNLIFVLNEYRELFPEIEGDGIDNVDKYFDTSWLGL